MINKDAKINNNLWYTLVCIFGIPLNNPIKQGPDRDLTLFP